MSHPPSWPQAHPLRPRPHPGRPAKPPRDLDEVSLDYAIDRFLAYVRGEGVSEGTIAVKRTIMYLMTEQLGGDFPVWQLTSATMRDLFTIGCNGYPADVNAWRRVNGLKARRGRNTKESREQLRTTLRQFCEFCHGLGDDQTSRWLSSTVVPPLHKIIAAKRQSYSETPIVEKKVVPPEQWEEMLDEAGKVHPRCRMAVALGLLCGRRVSEIAAMQWRHIDWDRGVITVWNKKAGRLHYIPLFPGIRAELMRYRTWLVEHYGDPQPDWYVCPAKIGMPSLKGPGSKLRAMRGPAGWPIVPHERAGIRSLYRDNLKLLAVYGIGTNDGAGTHTWRRSRAEELVMRAGIGAVQELLDHKSPATTQKYTRNKDGRMYLWAALMPGTTPPGGTTMLERPPIAAMLDKRKETPPDNVRPLRRKAS